ncbi:hypothetical protein BJV74DRAFT_799766 [Russula compacta]|nr:hypothetical protein BJV74DRAFT_799766 [Russula compacta]
MSAPEICSPTPSYSHHASVPRTPNGGALPSNVSSSSSLLDYDSLCSPASSSSSGSGGYGSMPPTPQSSFPAVQSVAGSKVSALQSTQLERFAGADYRNQQEEEDDEDYEMFPDAIYQHYLDMDRTRRLVAEHQQSHAASPCAYPDPNLLSVEATMMEMESIWDSVLVEVQKLDWPAALDWPLSPSTLAGGMALDEVPDSGRCHLPEYQLTQEWFDALIRDLNEAEEEKQVEAEIEEAAMETGMDVDGVEPRGERQSQTQLDQQGDPEP